MRCKIANCDQSVRARGLCGKHYQRLKAHGQTDIPDTPEQRFFAKVNKTDGCWLWTGAVAGGYGQCRSAPKVRIPAHRFSYLIHMGPIPAGMLVCHRCDNPICVNPSHLFLGTDSDNMRDMSSKRRHPKQRETYRAKLNQEQVAAIRSSTETTAHLARAFSVSDSTISKIRKGQIWRAE